MLNHDRIIAHVDADCFFASVELSYTPELKGLPVIVCTRTDNRGIALAATYEARPFGIKAGTPLFKVRDLCPQARLIPAHFERYQKASRHLMAILRDVSPIVDVCSIDEAYVDLTGLELMRGCDALATAEYIQKRVAREVGISVSIGIASNKLLAKMASDYRKPGGLTCVSQKNREAFLRDRSAQAIPGIGRKTGVRLQSYAIATAWDVLKSLAVPLILGKHGRELQLELGGAQLFELNEYRSAHQHSCSATRTFPEFTNDRDYIERFSMKLVLQAAAKIRAENLEAGELYFFLGEKNFAHYGIEFLCEPYTSEDSKLVALTVKAFAAIFRPGTLYRRAGIYLRHLRPKAPQQSSLFSPASEHSSNLQNAIDAIRAHFGRRSIRPAYLMESKPQK